MATVKYKADDGTWKETGKVVAINNSGEAILPTLSNPAAPSDVAAGKEYLDGSGIKQIGSLVQKTLPTLTTPASPEHVVQPLEYIDKDGNKQSGRMPYSTLSTPTISEVTWDENENAYRLEVTAKDTKGYVGSDRTKTTTKTFPKPTITGAFMDKGHAEGYALAYVTTSVDGYTAKNDMFSASIYNPNYKAKNIKKGINFFGITGTYKGYDTVSYYGNVTVNIDAQGCVDTQAVLKNLGIDLSKMAAFSIVVNLDSTHQPMCCFGAGVGAIGFIDESGYNGSFVTDDSVDYIDWCIDYSGSWLGADYTAEVYVSINE